MLKRQVAGLALLALSLACSDGGNAPSPSTFAGTWDASKLEFTNTSNTSQKVDVIALGATLVVVIESSGDYQSTLTLPGDPPEVTTGTWSASSDVFTMKETGSSGDRQFHWSMSGSTLTLSGANTDFDFDNNGTSESAKLTVVLVRR
jgi:hypothetical protein